MLTSSVPTTTSLENQVEEYFKLNEQAKIIEKQLKELRPTIETYVAQEANIAKLIESVTVKIGSFVATLAPSTRETFDLKSAKVEIPEAVAPFIKSTTFTTLKINKVIG